MQIKKKLTVKGLLLRCRDPRYSPGVIPYLDYIGRCGLKGYGFSAVLVMNWV